MQANSVSQQSFMNLRGDSSSLHRFLWTCSELQATCQIYFSVHFPKWFLNVQYLLLLGSSTIQNWVPLQTAISVLCFCYCHFTYFPTSGVLQAFPLLLHITIPTVLPRKILQIIHHDTFAYNYLLGSCGKTTALQAFFFFKMKVFFNLHNRNEI